MFGHQTNSDTNSQDNAVQHGSDAPADGTMGSMEPETIAPTAATPATTDDTGIGSYVVTDLPDAGDTGDATPAPASPPVIPHAADPAAPEEPQATPPPITPAATTAPAPAAAAPEASDLLTLKQSALHELSPLLGHLEQTPEEKFRTTMMMIQASDDHTMLQAAYEAARSIEDEKIRAQALLDVVNEINYFTQATTEAAS